MVDLVYPFDLAPLVPAPTADTVVPAAGTVEYLPVVE